MSNILAAGAVLFCSFYVWSGDLSDLIQVFGFAILSRVEHLIERKTK